MPVLLVAVRETFDVVEASLVVVVLGNCRSATLDAGVFSQASNHCHCRWIFGSVSLDARHSRLWDRDQDVTECSLPWETEKPTRPPRSCLARRARNAVTQLADGLKLP